MIAYDLGIVYILICQIKYAQRCAFGALEELQKRFAEKFREKAATAKPDSLDKAASSTLVQCCQKYDNVAEVDPLAAVTKRVDTVKLVMQENVELSLQNCVKLENLERTAEELQQQAGVFQHNAKELRKKMWWKKTKMQLCIAFIVLAALGGLIGMIVYLTKDDSKDKKK